jgi:hypothetical protein
MQFVFRQTAYFTYSADEKPSQKSVGPIGVNTPWNNTQYYNGIFYKLYARKGEVKMHPSHKKF